MPSDEHFLTVKEPTDTEILAELIREKRNEIRRTTGRPPSTNGLWLRVLLQGIWPDRPARCQPLRRPDPGVEVWSVHTHGVARSAETDPQTGDLVRTADRIEIVNPDIIDGGLPVVLTEWHVTDTADQVREKLHRSLRVNPDDVAVSLGRRVEIETLPNGALSSEKTILDPGRWLIAFRRDARFHDHGRWSRYVAKSRRGEFANIFRNNIPREANFSGVLSNAPVSYWPDETAAKRTVSLGPPMDLPPRAWQDWTREEDPEVYERAATIPAGSIVLCGELDAFGQCVITPVRRRWALIDRDELIRRAQLP